MPESTNDSPPAGSRPGSHGDGTNNFYPHRNGAEYRRVQKGEGRWQMIETSGFRTGKKRERNDTHGLLGVIAPVRMRHPGGAKNLQLSEK